MGKILGNASKPYARRTYRGVTLDNRTISALRWAERKYIAEAPKHRAPWRFGQGSYSSGTLSAGTHSGGGAVDIMFAGLNKRQRRAAIKFLRKAGFAAWAREGALWGANGSNDHAHAILLGHRTLSVEAMKQTDSYRAGRNGLANNALDPTWRPKVKRRWSHRLNVPVKGK